MELSTLSFYNQDVEERFCEDELAGVRRRRGLGLGQDAGRLFAVLAGAGRRLVLGRFHRDNALPLTAIVLLQLWEWRVHHTKRGSWRFRSGLSVLVSILTLLYLMCLSYVFLDPLNNPKPLGLAAFYIIGSGIGVLHLAGFATLVPYQWALFQQSILTLLFIDPVQGFCAAQPHVRRPIVMIWTLFDAHNAPAPVDIEEVRICTMVTRVALVLFGFVASVLAVYRTQMMHRRAFWEKMRRGYHGGGHANYCCYPGKLAPSSIVNALPGLLPPLTVFLFYITFKDLSEFKYV